MSTSTTATTGRDRFTDRSVIVTGAGSGIGRETALRFAREGGRVLVSDLDGTTATETAAMIHEAGGVAEVDVTDVSQADQVEAMVAHAVAAFGRVDVLHNNAYWAPIGLTLTDTSDEMWDRILGATLTSVFLGMRSVVPHMLDGGGGTIVNMASTAALIGPTRFAAYAAAKAGVIALTRSVAMDYGAQGIRCNTVAPGLIRTNATVPVFADEEASQRMLSRILVGRAGEPDDIANAVLFLASDESAFVMGQTLVVDGGRLIS